MQKAETNQEEGWFEKALADYDYEQPSRGQILEGVVLRIEEDAVIIDVGLKRDAIVPARDLSSVDKEVLEHLAIGDHVMVSVLQQPTGDQDLLVSLSQGMAFKSWEKAEKLMEAGTILELEVVGHNKGGVLVDFEGLRGFVPASHLLELRRLRSQQKIQQYKRNLVGEHLLVKAIEVDRKRRRLVFSALAAQEEQRKQRLKTLEEGQIFLQARVVSVVNFGIFVDLDGVDGLVHISEIDWRKVNHPSEMFKPGDKVDVKVIGIDVDKERISLSRKALLPSPWVELAEKYKAGDVVTGQVTKVLDFGAFVKLPEGIVGLVHVSEIGYSAPGSPKEVVKEGDKVLVRIMDINPEKERISLSMRRVPLERQIAWLTETTAGEATETAAEEPIAAAAAGEPEAQAEEAQVEEEAEPATAQVKGEPTEEEAELAMAQAEGEPVEEEAEAAIVQVEGEPAEEEAELAMAQAEGEPAEEQAEAAIVPVEGEPAEKEAEAAIAQVEGEQAEGEAEAAVTQVASEPAEGEAETAETQAAEAPAETGEEAAQEEEAPVSGLEPEAKTPQAVAGEAEETQPEPPPPAE